MAEGRDPADVEPQPRILRALPGGDRGTTRRIAAVAMALALVLVPLAAAPAGAQPVDEPAVVVELAADGSADVTVRSTFDLATDAEREGFQTLADDEDARQQVRVRFLERLRSVARDAENATGREMAVTDATIELHQVADGAIGVVTLSASWTGLAATEGETLVVTEPFGSGFSTDRTVVLRAPDGYEITSASPEPDGLTDTTATWVAGTELDGFAVELEPAGSGAGGDGAAQTGGQPGFGVAGALLAILGASLVVRRRTGP